MIKLYRKVFFFGTMSLRRLQFAGTVFFLIFFLSCVRESPAEDTFADTETESEADAEDPGPYAWEKIDREWIFTLKEDHAAAEEGPWSLFLYYSWTGEDESLPMDLFLVWGDSFSPAAGTAEDKKDFYFYPKVKFDTPYGFKDTFVVFHSEQWKELPGKIIVQENNPPGGNFTVVNITLENRSINSGPLIADPGTMMHFPASAFRQRGYEVFVHNLYPSLLCLVSETFVIQSLFLKRLAFFTEKTGFVGRLAQDSEIAGLRDWFAHDYRASDLANFFDLARKQSFSLNDHELLLRDMLLKQGIIRLERGAYVEGEGALLGFAVESRGRLPVYYVHEVVHGLDFIIPELAPLFLDFFNTFSYYEQIFVTDSFLNRDYNVIEDRQLLASETAAYLLQQSPERTDEYFRGYILGWFNAHHRNIDNSSDHYSVRVREFLRENPRIFAGRSAALLKEFKAITGLSAVGFYDLLPKNGLL